MNKYKKYAKYKILLNNAIDQVLGEKTKFLHHILVVRKVIETSRHADGRHRRLVHVD